MMRETGFEKIGYTRNFVKSKAQRFASTKIVPMRLFRRKKSARFSTRKDQKKKSQPRGVDLFLTYFAANNLSFRIIIAPAARAEHLNV